MDRNVTNVIDTLLITLGISISINDIESILGIIILSFQILWILSKFVVSVINKIKDKRYDEIDDELKSTLDELKEIKEGKENE